MDELDRKIMDAFPGKVVRKDLTNLIKKGANVPTYVLEYLLGMYCATDDEEIIAKGFEKIKQILTENYVKPDQSEYIKSKIRENGEYTIIDKIYVRLDEQEDKYVAKFANLQISFFEVSPSLVVHNEKLLLGGIWCIIRIAYLRIDENEEVDLFEETKKKKKRKSKYDSPFSIISLKPIQMPNLDLEEIISGRSLFSKEEWITLILRSAGYEPTFLSPKQRFHYLLRLVPLIQKNYNLVELGPRGTGKSHVYSELSPYSILISSGHTSTANMFYNLARHRVGLVGNWDCVAFDEVGGMSNSDEDTLQTLKNYMANGSFSRGTESINADASLAFEGNTFRSVTDMLRTTHLFEPFPEIFANDSAFFDRIHAYLPGWETPKLRNELLTEKYGLISDCLSEFCHGMRKFDFTDKFQPYFDLNRKFNKRDDIAVVKTFSGLAKLVYPHGIMNKDEVRELLEYSIEARRRVKEQLNKITPSEFKDIGLGYVDKTSHEEYVVLVPEQARGTLIFEGLEIPGYVYAIGRSRSDLVAVYRLENKIFAGSGKLESKNIEGLPSSAMKIKSSIIAAFNYFSEHAKRIVNGNISNFDYSLYYNDLQSKEVSDEVSVAEVVGLCSALANRSVLPGLAVVGRVVMSGSMMPLTSSLLDIMTAAIGAGAKKILLPDECIENFEKLPEEVRISTQPLFYSTPIEAARIALSLD